MRRIKKCHLAAALFALIFITSCLGPNHATGHLFKWNAEISNRWVRSGAFILLLPAYVIVNIGDLVIFNSMQWWTGTNPVSAPGGDNESVLIQVGDPADNGYEAGGSTR